MTWAGIFVTCIGLVVFLSSFDTPVFNKQPDEDLTMTDTTNWDTRARMLHAPAEKRALDMEEKEIIAQGMVSVIADNGFRPSVFLDGNGISIDGWPMREEASVVGRPGVWRHISAGGVYPHRDGPHVGEQTAGRGEKTHNQVLDGNAMGSATAATPQRREAYHAGNATTIATDSEQRERGEYNGKTAQ